MFRQKIFLPKWRQQILHFCMKFWEKSFRRDPSRIFLGLITRWTSSGPPNLFLNFGRKTRLWTGSTRGRRGPGSGSRNPENFKLKPRTRPGTRKKNFKTRNPARKIFKPGNRPGTPVSGPGRKTQKKPGSAPIPGPISSTQNGDADEKDFYSISQKAIQVDILVSLYF